jgi:L-asparaginase / beta-aspartyl-peptidase
MVRQSKIMWTRCFLICGLVALTALAEAQQFGKMSSTKENKIGLVVHGGAGTMERGKMTAEHERQYRAGIENALRAGWEILQHGGSSLDATEAAVRVLEDDPLFNAGKGAVFSAAGINEMDAAIMDGKTLRAGAVAVVQHVKNPISLARLVMEKSPHVVMSGAGAEEFAKEHGVELVDAKYFFTQDRWDAFQKAKAAEKAGGNGDKKFYLSDQDLHGTVGAVALDRNGNLAAATSTGGKTNKLSGRIGDTPIIGGGTYANNATCAVSGTGDGEFFIMATAAHDVSALMEYRRKTIEEASVAVIDKIGKLGGTGGMIAIDKTGKIALPFNTSGMYRGYVDANGKFVTEIYR